LENLAAFYRIDSLLDKLSGTEKRIVEYIKKNHEDIIRCSIVELAEYTKTSEATIVRLCKKLGYKGYQDFKISLAQEIKNPVEYIFEAAEKTDSCYDILGKEIGSIISTLQYTQRIIDRNTLETVADLLMKARKVVVYGSGNSTSVAVDAAHKFIRAGIDCTSQSDSHMQLITASGLNKDDVAIGISHSGSSKCIVQALKKAKDKGATAVCITNYGKSPITKVADYALFTASEEVKHKILAQSSRIAQLAIIDSLYIYMSINNEERAMTAIKNIEKALEVTKY
jgi:RpiR family carbohydrate utilization transcriptional regulator